VNQPLAPTTRDEKEFDVAIIGIVGLPARYGGFETLAEQLVHRLAARCRMLVYCSAPQQGVALPADYLGARLEYLRWKANGWQSVIYDVIALWRAAPRCRTLLVLGVSGCLVLPLLRWRFPRTRIVTNIDGIEWRRRKWGRAARWLLRTSEALAVRCSDRVVADNAGIRNHVQATYDAACDLIAYGGDSDPLPEITFTTRLTRFEPHSYYVTVCRIEPENNIAEILEAFQRTPAARLAMVGNWGASDFSRSLRRRFGTAPNIELIDPVYDAALLHVLRREAKAYVHGHSAGGTNPSLVEAMHAGLAVLSFDVEYNRHTMSEDGYYWSDALALAGLLENLHHEELQATASRLLHYARRHYTWQGVCEAYAAVLMTGSGATPLPRLDG
jgi:glycosyltransferase involved in cell wall biosynthesis